MAHLPSSIFSYFPPGLSTGLECYSQLYKTVQINNCAFTWLKFINQEIIAEAAVLKGPNGLLPKHKNDKHEWEQIIFQARQLIASARENNNHIKLHNNAFVFTRRKGKKLKQKDSSQITKSKQGTAILHQNLFKGETELQWIIIDIVSYHL